MRTKKFLRLMFSFLCLFSTYISRDASAAEGQKLPYQWHDSSQFSRVIVNATQGIEKKPKDWFKDDKLVADFQISNVQKIGRDAAAHDYQEIRHYMESLGLTIGTHTSGSTVWPEAQETYYPSALVPAEWMPSSARYVGNWPNDPQRKIIDVTDPATRHALQAGIRRLWQAFPAPVRFVDNAGSHRSTWTGSLPWASYCANIAEIRQIGHELGSRVIFNVSVHPGLLSDEEAQQLMQAVGQDGIFLEQPWHPNIQKNPKWTAAQIKRYRQLLDSGMGIILLAREGDEGRRLAAWLRTWRKPTDHVYIGGVFFKAPDLQVYGH